jgi:uncharacterized protein YigA (DUF484 family)
MASPVEQAKEEVQQAFAGFDPENMTDVRDFLSDFPGFFDEFATSLNALADKFENELPVNPAIPEHAREMTSVLSGLADHARELVDMFEKLHEVELRRLDEPREREDMWDQKANQQ